MSLTPKEREVLDLLERNLSNKQIALEMQGGETVKWHVKNLLTELDAGGRLIRRRRRTSRKSTGSGTAVTFSARSLPLLLPLPPSMSVLPNAWFSDPL